MKQLVQQLLIVACFHIQYVYVLTYSTGCARARVSTRIFRIGILMFIPIYVSGL